MLMLIHPQPHPRFFHVQVITIKCLVIRICMFLIDRRIIQQIKISYAFYFVAIYIRPLAMIERNEHVSFSFKQYQ